MNSAMLFSQRRDIPFAFTSRSPSMWAVEQFLRYFSPLLRVEPGGDLPWFATSVGIWLLHRDLWHECGGFDEQMIYMNNMERNMIDRLKVKYELVNLGKIVGHAFYHLDHHQPREGRKSIRYRRVNPTIPLENSTIMNPSGADWGLRPYDLQVLPAHAVPDGVPQPDASTESRLTAFVRLVAITAATSAWYGLLKPIHPHRWNSARGVVFKRRVETARDTVSGQPLHTWPSTLRTRWNERASRRDRSR